MRISDWSSDVCSSDLTRVGIVFNRVQTTSEVSKMLMERIGPALPANVVPHTIPHRENMREAALLEIPVWRLAKDKSRSAPVLREVVSHIVTKDDRYAAVASTLSHRRTKDYPHSIWPRVIFRKSPQNT